METTKRLQVSFVLNDNDRVYNFEGVVGIKFEQPWPEEIAVGLKCNNTDDNFNDLEFNELVRETYAWREEKDGCVTYFIPTSEIRGELDIY